MARLSDKDWSAVELVHAGQHTDSLMSSAFFQYFDLPEPDFLLSAELGSQANVTSSIMIAYEKSLQDAQPDLTVVVGDVNSSLACAISAKKVITLDVGGMKDVVGDNETGFCLPVGESNRFVRRLIQLLTSLEYRTSMGKIGRDLVKRDFDQKVEACRFVALYEELRR